MIMNKQQMKNQVSGQQNQAQQPPTELGPKTASETKRQRMRFIVALTRTDLQTRVVK